MKFGPVPPSRAEGAVLAHSVALADGRLRKGVVLEAAHVAALEAAGITQVTVARLDPEDVGEDAAAARLAAAVVPDPEAAGLRLGPAATGRVNILADRPGVVVIEEGAVRALNAVEPMITMATVPPFQQMRPGGMVATVKIISYALPGADLARACTLGAESLRVASVVYHDASLIFTEISGGAGDKGRAAIETRLDSLGMTLREVHCVPHERGALRAAILDAKGEMVLILTGSATSDPHDVGPSALREAGGEVIRVGMPVDPGNLLFLGQLGDKPVIGLPGSARSPVLHGADWVLSRVACGIPLSSEDIAGMAVGGLLKEIPTRPMPRRGRR
ncbi:molybdenum cofactor cytidylyltransferase [Salinihabitans flavidus]|uniref:Molybdenum cofactor cytidylyltransferase n=1 Tax=Salinihabitans flavidus TaxID=569882 RepID=A0A1H8UDC8_9RHOB|nr:molybdopterin-binding protein [Salinihabitans flavidus]SEP00854.1 molybdenum cofactor cytidylyltransferase [Salinihabitans flavidus]